MNEQTGQDKPQLINVLKDMGYDVADVIDLLGTSRATFYKKALNPNIAFLQEVRGVTSPRLDTYFPELQAIFQQGDSIQQPPPPIDPRSQYKKILQAKCHNLFIDYNTLLSKYMYLVKFMMKLASTTTSQELSEEIYTFIDNSSFTKKLLDKRRSG